MCSFCLCIFSVFSSFVFVILFLVFNRNKRFGSLGLNFWEYFVDNEDKELSISYQFGYKKKENTTDLNEKDSIIQIVHIKNINNEENFEQTFQVDYSHPLLNDHLIEIGGKMIMRNQKMDYETVDLTSTSNNDSLLIDEIFNYTQRINSLYI